MVSTVQNTDVTQKDAGHAVVIAITSDAVFDAGADEDDVFRAGFAFPLLQALHRVNEHLLEQNPTESLLFDIILITTSSQQQQQSSQIMNSTRHYGLEVGRFCFSSGEDFLESLLENKVQLFLSTDRKEMSQASLRGVLSALLDQQMASPPSEQLRVLLCGDSVVQPNAGLMSKIQQDARSFPAQLGKMRLRFGMLDSPLIIILVMSQGGRDSCSRALQVLRSCGVGVDEAYCLAGAPRGPILSLLHPHFLLSDGVSGLEE